MNVVFFDDNRIEFLPLTYTKPIALLRIGILTLEEKWVKYFEKNNVKPIISYLTESYLSKKYPFIDVKESFYINSRYCPNPFLIDFILNNINSNEAIYDGETLIAAKSSYEEFKDQKFYIKDYNQSFVQLKIEKITDLFAKNEEAIKADYEFLTEGRKSQELSTTNTLVGNNIFVEEGAKIEAAVLNSTTGPIYIGKDAEIMEGSVVRGPLAMCEGAVLKLSTKIYGATTVGPYSKVGGEVTNSIIQGYSNKGHDGFLGNSIIGEWCNLGADTNNSNLKNNYAEVKLWSYETERFKNTGLQFCGLVMGDHSKCGINTMFNTGTVVGVSANIFGSGFPRNFLPSFTWGGASGSTTYALAKVFQVAEKVMERRGVELTGFDKEILTTVFDLSDKYRK
ncbi:glucose-1-phosphate thymidylyltransferase [Vicingus serpentipes]|uniref:Glucose-1-phosphate thymidylyltransferase n=1 Tax=Vicingus serpentipes TaxID=1926625 RepID=A0A5C6RT10_9FLAO|nr:GlmU family protein [Vicingus serpentipes]TXB65481.1 glucose-1-phosphate thymidylyltransferase [Vicingus serpentipes]